MQPFSGRTSISGLPFCLLHWILFLLKKNILIILIAVIIKTTKITAGLEA
jgi:hypothetical protein